MTEPPWSALDTGIRATVRLLWDAGFVTTDSGDGTKEDMACAIGVPHVFMRCDPAVLVVEARRLAYFATSHRLVAAEGYGSAVQATYSPADGVAMLMLFGTLRGEQ